MFKEGQSIRLVNNLRTRDNQPFPHITKGKVYKIVKMADWDGHPMVWIVRDDGGAGNYLASRFEELKPTGVFKIGDKVKLNLNAMVPGEQPQGTKLIVPGTNIECISPGIGQIMYEWADKNVDVEFEVTAVPGKNFAWIKLQYGEEIKHFVRYYLCAAWLLHVNDEPVEFAIGDDVCVVRKGDDGVAPRWVAGQDKAIGKKRKVKAVEKGYVVLSDNYAYQTISLEKWVEAKHGKPKIKSLRAIIAKGRKEAKPSGLCSFTLFKQGTAKSPEIKIFQRMQAPCHAGLNSLYDDGGSNATKKVLAVIDHLAYHIKYLKFSENRIAAYKKWLEYVSQQSPWAPAYKQKTVRSILASGADMNVEVSGNVLATACIAMRMGTEYTDILDGFGYWIKQGIKGHAAFILAYTFGDIGTKKVIHSRGMTGGHEALYGGLLAQSMLSFFKNGYNKDQLEGTKESYTSVAKYRVQEPINETKADEKFAGVKGCWTDYVQKNAKAKVTGQGWDKEYTYKIADVIAFAKHLEEVLA